MTIVVMLGVYSDEDIERCIGVLDEILDLYDVDDDDDAELYRPTQPVTSSHLPLQSCAEIAARNREIRQSIINTGQSHSSSKIENANSKTFRNGFLDSQKLVIFHFYCFN